MGSQTLPRPWTPQEIPAAQLVNAKTAGDAGGRADHFDGTALGSRWTQTLAPNSSGVANGAFGFSCPNGLNAAWSQPFTPSGDFRIEARISSTAVPITSLTLGHGPNLRVGADNTANSIGGNDWVASEANEGFLLSNAVAGTYSPLTYTNCGLAICEWCYIALARTGTTYAAFASTDRKTWLAVGTVTRTMTVNFIILAGFMDASTEGFHAFDFVDVVA